MASSKVYGVSKIRFGSVDHRTKPGTTCKFGLPNKTPQPASGLIAGFSEEPAPTSVSGAFLLMADTDAEAIFDYEGPVSVVTDVGHTWVFPNCEITESPELSDGGGGIGFTLMGRGRAIKAK